MSTPHWLAIFRCPNQSLALSLTGCEFFNWCIFSLAKETDTTKRNQMSLLLQRTNHGHARNWVMGIEKQVDAHEMPRGSYNDICNPKMDKLYACSV
jgi:hypothetical protein